MKNLRANYSLIVGQLRKLSFLTIASTLLALLNQEADAQTFSSLYSFKGGNLDGAVPEGALVLSGGSLYGTTFNGGSSVNIGTVFGFDSSEHLVHSFNSIGLPSGGGYRLGQHALWHDG
jgi:uncharacterized repeat protein (TIGR03803 family)